MVAQIVNAAPMVIDYGIQDLSTVPVNLGGDILPQHLPKFYTFAEMGDVLPHIVSGAQRDKIFGTNTFDLRGKYATHTTPWINGGNAEANMMVLQRLIPEDAGPNANLLLSLDVLATKVDDYERNFDGTIKLNASNEPTIIGQLDGYRVKWVVTHLTTDSDYLKFGTADPVEGDQLDDATGARSMRYPIWQLSITSKGSYGNDRGIRIWAPTIDNSAALHSKMMSQELAYPYYISVVARQEGLTTAKVVKTIFGDQKIMVTFKPEVIDPLTDKELYIGDTFLDSYQNLTEPKYGLQVGDFGRMKIYQSNVELLVKMFHTAEIPYIDAFSDFNANSDNAHLFNFVSGCSSQAVPYHSFVFTDAANSTRLTEYTNVYASGGSDGTMTEATFNALAKADMLRYLDDTDELAGDAVAHPESTMWDTGWPLEIKYAMMSFFSIRKDTWSVLSTYTADSQILANSEEHSMGIALRTRAMFYPESDYFGTPTCRASIFSGSAKLLNSQWKKRVPTSYDFFIKICKYMGAAQGSWKQGKSPSGEPGHIINTITDLSIPWIPCSVRNRFWDVGLNWVQRYDMRSFFWPSYKTVYTDDTSVLNSIITVAACTYLNRVAHSVWRDLSGRDDLSEAQLIKIANDKVTAKVKDKFDNRYTIVPDAQITEMDSALGYVWHMPIKIYANTSRQVMITYVQAYRANDLVK